MVLSRCKISVTDIKGGFQEKAMWCRLRLGFAKLSRILPTPRVFISGYANTGKKVFYCFYKITFPRKKKNSLLRLLIKREILTSREVLYTKLNVRVISSCFTIKMLYCKIYFINFRPSKDMPIHTCKKKKQHVRSMKEWSMLLSKQVLFQANAVFIFVNETQSHGT